VCDVETPTVGGLGQSWTVAPQKRKKRNNKKKRDYVFSNKVTAGRDVKA
jgi:glycerate kinase